MRKTNWTYGLEIPRNKGDNRKLLDKLEVNLNSSLLTYFIYTEYVNSDFEGDIDLYKFMISLKQEVDDELIYSIVDRCVKMGFVINKKTITDIRS